MNNQLNLVSNEGFGGVTFEIDEKMIVHFNKGFVLCGSYQGHDDVGITFDTTWFVQMVNYLGKNTANLEPDVIVIPWGDIEMVEKLDNDEGGSK